MQSQVTGPPQRKLAPITTRTFGRFRLERRLAYGGMAEILLATELRSGKQMVLKRILPQYLHNPEFVQFFIHEGRLGQRLVHPNLVATHEAGQVGDNCYIALEYLRGATCIELLRAAAKAGLELPLGAAVRIVADAARGLHHAHLASDSNGKPLGVVHRDVTPHNLFLCRDGVIKVLDFGIANSASQLHVTRTGTLKGKFSYLAPEQIRGESIDRRVDVFALGIVLHELLTLKPLFRGINDADTLNRIMTLEVPPPERVRHAVPPGLGAVALRALQRDRDRRLPSAEALANSIEAVAEAECIDASPDVVAALLAELCPPPPEEEWEEAELDFGPEPPSARSRSAPGAVAMTLPPPLPPLPAGPLALPQAPPPPPPPQALSPRDPPSARPEALSPLPEVLPPTPAERPQLLVLGEGDLVPPVLGELQVGDTLPNLPPIVEVEPPLPVALGHGTGAAPMVDGPRAGRSSLWLVVVAVTLGVLGVLLVHRRQTPAPAPPPPVVIAPPPLAAPPPVVVLPEAPRVAAPLVQEGLLRVITDGAVSLVVDGKSQHPAADGALHLPPGRHKLMVSGSQLLPRSFEVEIRHGETATRTFHSGRGRLKLAVTPWAEVQLDGRTVGTTPLQPLDLVEGVHVVQLKNGELKADVKRRITVSPDKETALRVDLFSDRR